MAKIFNKISYFSTILILFGLIAIFFIIRNALVLKNLIEIDATCYSYETSGDTYKTSYFYTYNDKTYYITEEENKKPKLSSKIKLYCNKKSIKQCITNKKRYIKGLYISIFSLIPVIVFLIIENKKRLKYNYKGE